MSSTPSSAHSLADNVRHVRLNFIVTIAASWLSNPLGVLLLHFLGFGADPHLVTWILATSAAAPLQLMFNEYLAASTANRHFAPSRIQIGLLLLGQIATSYIVSGQITNGLPPVPAGERVLLSLFLAISTLLSYRLGVRYYRATVHRRLPVRQSAITGAIPGVTTLGVCILAGLTDNIVLVLLGALLPAVLQYIYIFTRMPAVPDDASPAPFATLPLLVLALVIAAASLAATWLRAEIAFSDSRFVALIIMGLNMIGTIVMMLSRASYLTGGGSKHVTMGVFAIALAVAGAAALPISHLVSMLLWMLAIQISIAAAIAIARAHAQQDEPVPRSD